MENFLIRLDANRGYSFRTIANYKRTLIKFNKYLKTLTFGRVGIETPEKISLLNVEQFIQNEKIKGRDTRTCNNYLACIKLYFRYCLILGKDVLDYRTILYAKEIKKKIDSLSDQDVNKLLNYFQNVSCKNHLQEIIKTRNLCIATMLLYTGLRVGEISNIKISDVRKNLQIIGKGGVRRVVFLNEKVLSLIELYLFLRKDKSDRLFVSHSCNNKDEKLSTVSIDTIIREGAKNCGISEKCRPHKLRHTFATKLLKNDTNIVYIQKLLGHQNIQTTQNYLSVYDTDLEEIQGKISY